MTVPKCIILPDISSVVVGGCEVQVLNFIGIKTWSKVKRIKIR